MNLTPDSSLTVTAAAQKLVEQYAAQCLAGRGLRNLKYCILDNVMITYFDEDNHGEWLRIDYQDTLEELRIYFHEEKQLMTMDEALSADLINFEEYRTGFDGDDEDDHEVNFGVKSIADLSALVKANSGMLRTTA